MVVEATAAAEAADADARAAAAAERAVRLEAARTAVELAAMVSLGIDRHSSVVKGGTPYVTCHF